MKPPQINKHGRSNNSTAHARRAPVAPPAYRPQPAPKVLQRKPSSPTLRDAPSGNQAPAVYRPQPAPRVLQVKATAALVRGTKAPPVYRSDLKKIVQPKLAAVKWPVAPKAPPVYRPQPIPRILQTKQSPATPACCKGKRLPDKNHHVVQRQQGRVGPATPGRIIQRYSLIDKPVKGKLSEDKNIIVTDRNGLLYATVESVESANRQLALAGPFGSLIRLVREGDAKESKEVGKTFYSVKPVINKSAYEARLASRPGSFHKDLKPDEKELKLWADCRRTSEVVTGASSSVGFNDRLVKVNGSYLPGYSGDIKRPSGTKNDSTTARLAFQVYASEIGSFFTRYGRRIFDMNRITHLFPDSKDMKDPDLGKWLKDTANAASDNISVAERLYASLRPESRDRFHQETRTNEYANPGIGDAYSIVTEFGMPDFKPSPPPSASASGGDWQFHWGGVVMKGGTDNVTLENLSVGDESVLNSKWFFAMYGTVDAKQSFHARQTATGHHGNIATTITAVTVGSTERRKQAMQALRDRIALLRERERITRVDEREGLLAAAWQYNELAESMDWDMMTEAEVLGSPHREFTRAELARVPERFRPKRSW